MWSSMPCPRLHSVCPSGPPGREPCHPQSHVLSCSSRWFTVLVPLCFSLPLLHWAFNLLTSFQLSFCPLSWDLCSLLASLCLSVPDFDLCIYTLALEFPCCSNACDSLSLNGFVVTPFPYINLPFPYINLPI